MTESDVRRRTGLSRKTVERIRKELKPGQDYHEKDGVVELTPAGVAALEQRGIAVPNSDEILAHEKKTGVVARVVRCFPLNQCILEAQKKDGELVKVRVRDNRLFVRDQEIPIMPQPDMATWLLACRQPRIRGRLRWEGQDL